MANQANVVLDIETVIHPITQADIDEFMLTYKPPANHKRPEAILSAMERASSSALQTLEQERKFSLGGKRMISVALGVADKRSRQVENISSAQGDDAGELCRFIAEYLNEFESYRIVGWNVEAFDLLEIMKQFALTQTPPPRYAPGKWDIIDLCNRPFKKLKMKEAAKAFGLEVLPHNGADVAEFYAQQDWATIKSYNEHDVFLCGRLFLYASNFLSF